MSLDAQWLEWTRRKIARDMAFAKEMVRAIRAQAWTYESARRRYGTRTW